MPNAVVSLVSARIAAERRAEVEEPYRAAIAAGLPPGIEQTMLLAGEDGVLSILTVWRSREDLDAMRAGGEEPLARRLLREAGGDPVAAFFDVAARSK